MTKVSIIASSERKLFAIFVLAFALVFALGIVAVEMLGLVLALLLLIVILVVGGIVVIVLDDRR